MFVPSFFFLIHVIFDFVPSELLSYQVKNANTIVSDVKYHLWLTIEMFWYMAIIQWPNTRYHI